MPDSGPAWRDRLHEIIFEADTPRGKVFDVVLLVAIVVSVIAVCLESVQEIDERFGPQLYALEWVMTGLFSIEYVLRLIAVRKPLRYAFSFYGLVDLLAIIPTYMSLIIGPGAQSLLVIRALRLLRVFRVFKLSHFLGEAQILRSALNASIHKILVFMLTVLTMVLIIGAAMYLIEGDVNDEFSSIPQSIYWAIVTMTTVGYGDVAPTTVLGKTLASVVMITGYGIIAVPTGIVTVELSHAARKISTQACPSCSSEGHSPGARFCKDCGSQL